MKRISQLEPKKNECFVWEHQGELYREVVEDPSGRWRGIDNFLLSKDFIGLQDIGWVPRHSTKFEHIEGKRLLKVDRIPFFNKPNEWTREQLRDAAVRVLKINKFLEDRGSQFRAVYCSADNVTFHYTNPVYVDAGSFSMHNHGWVFGHLQRFLQPLDVMLWPTQSYADCISLLADIDVEESDGEWSKYPQPLSLTGEESWLLNNLPNAESVIDVGGNGGRFASICGLPCVMVDNDRKAVQRAYRRTKGLSVTPLVVDVTSSGWRTRLAADVVVASSITHHLFRQGMGWSDQVDLWNKIGNRYAMVEYIDRSDDTLANWELPEHYDIRSFKSAFLNWQLIAESNPEKSTRTWTVWKRL